MRKLALWLATFAWAGYTLYLTTLPNYHPTPDTLLNSLLGNGGHFVFFGVLAVLLFLDLSHIAISILLTSLYGALIEYLQRSIPGRTPDIKDWLLDTAGAVIFLIALKKLEKKS